MAGLVSLRDGLRRGLGWPRRVTRLRRRHVSRPGGAVVDESAARGSQLTSRSSIATWATYGGFWLGFATFRCHLSSVGAART